MNRTVASRTPIRSERRVPRLMLGVLLSLALAAGLPGAPLAAAADADRARPADRPWIGFPIKSTGTAAGGWIGGRKFDQHEKVYRIDPRATPNPGGFKRARWVGTVNGAGKKRYGANARATARAAWIVAKYGTYRYDVQAAAVDAAVLHLLARHQYRIGSKRGKARIKQTPYPGEVRRFARTMLDGSARFAGPYRVSATQVGQAFVGDQVRIDTSVRSATGAPMGSLGVQVRVGGGAWQDAGKTSPTGNATFRYRDDAAGPKRVDVRVGSVPPTKLLMRAPKRNKASRIVIAGRKGRLQVSRTAVVRARPAIAITGAHIRAMTETRGKFVVSGMYGRDERAAQVFLHGPFKEAGNVDCTKRLRSKSIRISGNGEYRLPQWLLGRTGHYVWRISTPMDTYNAVGAQCAGRFDVR